MRKIDYLQKQRNWKEIHCAIIIILENVFFYDPTENYPKKKNLEIKTNKKNQEKIAIFTKLIK